MINKEFTTVTSGQIKGVRWENKVLEIKFSNDSIYRYTPVEEKLYKELISNVSPGSVFHKKIKKNKNIIFKSVTHEYKN